MEIMDANDFRVEDLSSSEADVTFDNYYKLKLTSKKLRSGKCQVKFFATIRERRDMYGYVLVDAQRTLKEVVSSIRDRLHTIHQTRDFHNLHLYSIGKTGKDDLNFIIFDS
ncbi:hypothetical protein [Marinoscillum sp. MHG1-6]|uniref:hypothetical protein n=1 Tax=Marinoscillum sp. MHG1-6 TaxID=2959627 RepID=UPI002157C086|nr:hypothetical protein [Marinoscillum sp. MHG1-6]